jgi:uncharacterized protein YdhG (YjbR/CyaY superfamily)
LASENDSGFPALSAPARRALSGAGYTRLDQLVDVYEADLGKLHGIGPRAIVALREALHRRGLSFRTSAAAIGDRDSALASPDVVDEYLRRVEEPKRGTLQTLRSAILEIVPEAEEVISYGLPAFRVRGHTVAGFAAFKDHLSYLPFSGSVLAKLGDELAGYTMTRSSLHFPVDRPLARALVAKLIEVRLAETGRRTR